MRSETVSFHMHPALLAEARETAEREGIDLDHLIHSALAEKLAALRPESFFRERARKADLPKALGILRDPTRGQFPDPEDTL